MKRIRPKKKTRAQKQTDNLWILFACIVGMTVCVLASQAWPADLLIALGDQPGDSGYRDGDVVNVYTDAMIADVWAQIPTNDPEWAGNPRTSMPLRDALLKRFVVFSITDADAVGNRDAWVAFDPPNASDVTRKRKYWVFWWEHLTAAQRLDVANPDIANDYRATITISAASVLQKPTTSLIFETGDSITLQSASYFIAALPDDTVHSNVVNNRDSWRLAANVFAYMNDPDNDPVTPAPGTYNVVRWNCGIWDCQPHGTFDNITSKEDFRTNFTTIVSEIRRHSPRARIIYSNSRDIDANRLTLDPPPATGFLDIDTYNAALADYRVVATEECPKLNVVLDDKNAFYTSRTAAQEGLTASHVNTGVYWSWDGIHFDENYREFEGEKSANAVKAVK